MKTDFRVDKDMKIAQQSLELTDMITDRIVKRRIRHEARIILAMCGLANAGAKFTRDDLRTAYSTWLQQRTLPVVTHEKP